MKMWLYQLKLCALDSEFVEATEKLKKLHEDLPEGPTCNKDFDKSLAKLRLDVAIGLVRIIKEHAAFYLKLRESYDWMRLAEEIMREVMKADPDLGSRILKTIKNRWKLSIPDTDKGSDS
jgi:hypothetical protein